MPVRVERDAEPIPGYRLIERLGGGGFGEVWSAQAPGGMIKAIKFVFGDLSATDDNDQRAKQELKAMERVRTVRHPYILTLERYEVIDGQLIVVMELADRSLWDRFKECRSQGLPGVPREELLRYMEEAAEALDLMNHEHQLQHLDIKPQNLFLVHNHVKVADFGLVKDFEGSQASVTGGITPVYAAPETFDGKVSRFSDQYSLAILYQEILTGQRPFNGTNVRQLIMQHISGQPNVTPLPPGDQKPIARALSKQPNDRHANCRDLVALLRASAGGGPTSQTSRDARAVPDTTPYSPHALLGFPQDPQEDNERPTWHGRLTPASDSSPSGLRKADSSQGATQNIRAIEKAVLRPQEPSYRTPAEITGPGSLFPALIIGLGQTGLSMIQSAGETMHNQLAPLSQLPHLRFLLIDSDSEVMRAATHGAPGASMATSDVLLAPLNRPSHYLKPRDGRPPLESWLNPKMLYRIPRSQVTTGVRGLGRLAFCDNYRAIVRRLEVDLEAILEPQHLAGAARQTGRGLRTNRPRVYILTGLTGGTGSGMFLDLAYTVRALLRQMGYDNPDVVGLLLLPPVDASRSRMLSLGNAYAALTELHYFGSPGTVFQARYHDREAAIQDADPPFSRTLLLKLPDESDEVASREVFDLCGQFLYRDLTTPLGKAADLGRAEQPAPPWDTRGQFFQTFNLFQLSWPRQAVQNAFARQLCQQLLQRWISKDSKPLREPVQNWIEQQWALLELGSDHFIHRVQTDILKKLGSPAESVFSKLVEPLNPGSAQGTDRPASPSGWLRSRSPEPRGLDPEKLIAVLRRFEELLGKPKDDHAADAQPELIGLLRSTCERLANEWSQKLAVLSVKLIEEPQFRLAGAEESIRQIVATIEQILQHHEPLCRDLTEKAAAAYETLWALAGTSPEKPATPDRRPAPPPPRKPNLTPGEAFELLKWYPKWRFQSMLLQHLAASFVGIRGHLSDELREVNFCRVRLGELARLFDEMPGEPLLGKPGRPLAAEEGLGRKLFLSGCKNLSEAVRLCVESITPENLLDLDGRMEVMLKKTYTALVHVCLTSANILKDVQAGMLAVAGAYAAETLPAISAAALFFEQHPDEEQAANEIATFFDEAAPEITAGRNPRSGVLAGEQAILSAPQDEDSERFRRMLSLAAPEAEVQPAGSPDDLVIYRERYHLALSDLEHLGAVGHNAYIQMTSTDNFTPHCRSDIEFRQS